MKSLTDYKLKLKDAIDARDRATQGEWHRIGEHSNPNYDDLEWTQWIALSPELECDYVAAIHAVRSDDRENAEFIVLAANNFKQICEAQLKLIGSVEKFLKQEQTRGFPTVTEWMALNDLLRRSLDELVKEQG